MSPVSCFIHCEQFYIVKFTIPNNYLVISLLFWLQNYETYRDALKLGAGPPERPDPALLSWACSCHLCRKQSNLALEPL